MTTSVCALAPPDPGPAWLALAVRADSVALARRFARDVVAGRPADPYVVALIVSELVTNALRAAVRVHALGEAIRLGVTATPRWTHLQVADPSPVPPTPRECGAGEECGRGLTIIAAHAAVPLWCTPHPPGKTVHALIAAPGITLAPGEIASLRGQR